MWMFPQRKNKVPRNSLSDRKVVIFRRKKSGVKNRGGVDKRRDFRIDRLKERTKLISQRKWVFMAIAVIVVAIAAVVFKIL